MSPVLSDRKDSTSQLRQETAALRDFGLAYDGFGSQAAVSNRSTQHLFDHLVGEQLYRVGHIEAEPFVG
jgi:hypothetical protein